MTGIEKIGVHLPRYRLARGDIAAIWGGRGKSGERSVANYDEDVITMAVAAAESCLVGVDRHSIDMVVLASTTYPYAEKQCAAIVAEALDLATGVNTIDIASSLRGGTQALRIGLDALAGGARRVLIAVADQRKSPAGSKSEAEFGDGAVALLLGPEATVAVRALRGDYDTTIDRWRLASENFVNQGDERFTSKVIFQDGVAAAMGRALKAAQIAAGDIKQLAIAAADHKAAVATARAAGLKEAQVAGSQVYERAGHCGTAAGLLNLAAALETAAAGDNILVVDYGDGTDFWLATAKTATPVGTPVTRALEHGRPLPYAQFLRFKDLVENEVITPYTSEISVWRDEKYLIRLYAPRCNKCGAIQYPPRRICSKCQTKDDFTEVQLAKHGKLFTFTVEHLFPIPDKKLITGTVDLSDGARLYTQLTDCAPEEAKIGMDLQLSFRVLHRGGGFIQYFWKAAPVFAA